MGDIDRTVRLLELLPSLRNFAASVTGRENAELGESDWAEAHDLAEKATGARQDLPIVAASLHQYLCGRFEYFVRDIVQAIADERSSEFSSYADLPDKMRAELYQLTISVAGNPGRYRYSDMEAHSFLKALADNLVGDRYDPLNVKSEILAITESNMTQRTIVEVFKRVGLEDIWSTMAQQAALRSHLGAKDQGECSKLAISKLSKIMNDRNSFAHPTSSTTFPDPEQVLSTCEFFRAFSSVMVDVAKLPR
ncbi:hypothetical protein GOOTI_266_00230 [Gordonia otitidis NBRC 100426]|uniref:RiboL-PSP-HEPN domain-containing protein n=2 Tax=Gordonia otitidis TaxID=249058 RepID=H5TUH6_GORO1|nr:hypothetical protein GOOTI_266_00230 [Gordonia otitidis NBRC 100426]